MNDIIKIRASLEPATIQDCIVNDKININRVYFVKNVETGQFKNSLYKTNYEADDEYFKKELRRAIVLNEIFKLSSNHCSENFCFKLLLRLADEFDLFSSKNTVKENFIYYVREIDEVTGPYIMKKNASFNKVWQAFENKKIYVPCSIQELEEIK